VSSNAGEYVVIVVPVSEDFPFVRPSHKCGGHRPSEWCFRGDAIVGLHIRCLDTHAVAIRSDVGQATDRVYRAHEPHVLI
jgi:hypothetical protein